MKSVFSAAAVMMLSSGAVFAQTLPTADLGSISDAATSSVMGSASDALTVENFDPATVNALIDASSLDDGTKTTLKDGVAKAEENPELVQGVLDQVKSALGM